MLLDPYIGVVTNIDNDHLGFYGNFDNEKLAFMDFINNSRTKILNLDEPLLKHAKNDFDNVITYSISHKRADIFAYDIRIDKHGSVFNVKTPNREFIDLELGIIGMHNVSNALSVIAIADVLNIEEKIVRTAFLNFKGVDRRFTFVGRYRNYDVYDDYAHHPTEIKATIDTAKLVSDKVYAIFQPHRFSRTSYLMDDFSKTFKNVERVFVLDIYSAAEKPIEGIDSEILSEKINEISANAVYIRNVESLRKFMDQIEGEGVIVGLGAGSISEIVRDLVDG